MLRNILFSTFKSYSLLMRIQNYRKQAYASVIAATRKIQQTAGSFFLILLLNLTFSSTANAVVCDEGYAPKETASAHYPRRAQKRGIEGYASVKFTITEKGEIKDIEVIESEPKGVFDRAALKATSQYKFDACIENNQAVEIKDKKLRFDFRLKI